MPSYSWSFQISNIRVQINALVGDMRDMVLSFFSRQSQPNMCVIVKLVPKVFRTFFLKYNQETSFNYGALNLYFARKHMIKNAICNCFQENLITY